MASAKPITKPAVKPQVAVKPTPAAVKPAAKPSTAVARPANTAVAVAADTPDYIKRNVSRGNENVGTSDLVIPRLEVAQVLSPCLDKKKPEYIEGAENGDIFNTVTREVYKSDEGVMVIPLLYKKEYLVWKDRQKGGGFRGSYPTLVEANERIAGEEDSVDLEAAETGQQLVLVLRPDGTTDDTMMAMVSMSRTKLKVSKNWNSLIRLAGGDRFSRVYRLFSVDEQNSNNQDYKNFGVIASGFPSQEAYETAESIYEGIAGGQLSYKMDTSQEGTGDEAAPAKREY